MDARSHLRILRRSAVLVLALPIIGAGAAGAYTQTQTPLYQAGASVYVSAQQANSAIDLSQGGSYAQDVVKNYAQIAEKPIVLDPVIDRLNLDTTPAQLAGQVSVQTPLNTTLLEITVMDASPQRAADIANAVATSLIAVVPELSPTSTTSKLAAIKITSVAAAVASDRPVSPAPARNILLGLLAGVVLGIAAAYLREALDVRIRSVADVQRLTTRPVLGGIVHDRLIARSPLIVHTHPRDPRSEAFRTLRTNLEFLEVDGREKSMVITSSLASEGKTTSSTNLALAIAEAGKRVLLIDADLRRPRVHQVFGISGAIGLTDVLIDRVTLEDALQTWGDSGLTVLPAGPIPPNPSELLQSQAMSELLAGLEDRFDTILLDSPPLLPVSDAAILARRTGGAIVVTAANRSNRNHLKSAIASLEQVNASVLGVLITMLPKRGVDAKEYGAYGYRAYGDKQSPAAPVRRRAFGRLRRQNVVQPFAR